MSSDDNTNTVMPDDWTTIARKKNIKYSINKNTRKKCVCDSSIHKDYCEFKIHSPRVLAGVSKVIFKSTFLSSSVSVIFTDLNVKLTNEQIENTISKAIKSDDINIKKAISFIQKITWITKVIEHYYETRSIPNTRASIQMIEYWINYIDEFNNLNSFMEEFHRRLELTKEFLQQNNARTNTLAAFLPQTNLSLDFEPMPINSDMRNNKKTPYIPKNKEHRQNSINIIASDTIDIRSINTSWRDIVNTNTDIKIDRPEAKNVVKQSAPSRASISEEEYILKQISGEIPQGFWCVFILWTRFCYDKELELIDSFNNDFKKGRVKRQLLKLIHPDHISSSLKEKATMVGQELSSRIEQFEVYFKDADMNVSQIPGWNETFDFISKTSLSHTSFNKSAFYNELDNAIIKLVKTKLVKNNTNPRIDIVSAIDKIIRWSAVFKNGAVNGSKKDIIRITNDVLEFVNRKRDKIPENVIEFIFGSCNSDKWDPNEIINFVPCLKYKFNNITENVFESYFGRNILCITSPMLREFILRMIRSNFGSGGSSNELIEYSYINGVKLNYIDPENENDKHKHLIIYILIRIAFLAVYEKNNDIKFTLDMRQSTPSFAKIKSLFWEETPFQQYIMEYVNYQNKQKFNLIFGKLNAIFNKYKVDKINYIVKCFCMKLIKTRNLKYRNSIIFNAGLDRINNKFNYSKSNSNNDDLEDWERDEYIETSIILLNRKMTDLVLHNNNNQSSFKFVTYYEVGVLAGNPKYSDLSKNTFKHRNAHQMQSAKYIANSLYMKQCIKADNEGVNPPVFDSKKEYDKAFNIQKTKYSQGMMKSIDKIEFISDLLNIPINNVNNLYDNINSCDKYTKWVLNTITDDFITNLNNNRINRLKSNGWNNFRLYENNIPKCNPPAEFWNNYDPELYSIYKKRVKQRDIMVKGLIFFNSLKGNKKIESNDDINSFYSKLKSVSNIIIRPNDYDTFIKSYSNCDNAPHLLDSNNESQVRAYQRQSEMYDGKTRLDYIRSLATIKKV